ncbi:MAG: glycosyltransferase family 2 protein [Bacilli bacterium]
MKLISIVVPMYNEEKVVPLFFAEINKIVKQIHQYQFEIVVVNDGSKDQTLNLLKAQQRLQNNLIIVNLSRNFGHEPAVAAGIKTAKGDAIIPMDADLQDPPALIQSLLSKFEEGFEVVNAKRKGRHEDTFFKRFSAIKFYQFVAKLSGKIKIPQNVGHFRLISRRVADEVNRLSERNRVFRIEVPFVGFKTTEVLFDRPKRAAGETHYNLKSMLKLAVDAIASTTSVPLVWPIQIFIGVGVTLGLSVFLQIVLYFSIVISENIMLTWILGNVILFMFTLLFFVLSILSLYLSRIFIETQNRPFYIIDEVISGRD